MSHSNSAASRRKSFSLPVSGLDERTSADDSSLCSETPTPSSPAPEILSSSPASSSSNPLWLILFSSVYDFACL